MDTIVALILSFLKAGIIVYLVVKVISGSLSFGGISAKLQAGARSLSQAAKSGFEKTSFGQRSQMAKQSRENLRKRKVQTSFSENLTKAGPRGSFARFRAGGVSTTGRQYAQQAAEESLKKEQAAEAQRASSRMTTLGIEGDDDLFSIASASIGDTYEQERKGQKTGVTIKVTEPEKQAAINSLAQQGRIKKLRELEAVSSRGPGGTPQTQLHHMLDEAYKTPGNKVADKAPDLMPNRRATEGTAAFTDLQMKDVAAWHSTTFAAANDFYSNPAAHGMSASDASAEREKMLRSFSLATQNTATANSLSIDQVKAAKAIMDAHPPTDATVIDNINGMYEKLGGSINNSGPRPTPSNQSPNPLNPNFRPPVPPNP